MGSVDASVFPLCNATLYSSCILKQEGACTCASSCTNPPYQALINVGSPSLGCYKNAWCFCEMINSQCTSSWVFSV